MSAGDDGTQRGPRRARVLAVTPWVPSPRRPRSLGLLTAVARHHDVTLVAATWDEEDLADLAALPVHRTVAVPLRRATSALRALRGVVTGDSLQRAYLSDPALARAVRREVAGTRPDLGYLHVLRTTHLRPAFGDVPCVLDLDEYRSGFYRQMARTSRHPLWRQVARVEARRMARIEAGLDEAYRAVMLSAPGDVPGAHPVRTLVRSPASLDRDRGGGPGGPGEVALTGRSLLFVGRLSYRANTEALAWFVEQVLPGVRARVPDAHLTVVGDAPTRAVRGLAGPGVTVLGRVADVAPYYRAAEVSLVPVTLATGVQMKLIEALACGVPTVASPVTAAQAGVRHEQECLVADGAAAWVEQVVRLLQDDGLRVALAARGRSWAASAHDPEAVARAVLGVVDAALHPSGPPSG